MIMVLCCGLEVLMRFYVNFRKKTIIHLDDLLVDHYKEKNRVVERTSKLAKTKKNYANSDDEEDGR